MKGTIHNFQSKQTITNLLLSGRMKVAILVCVFLPLSFCFDEAKFLEKWNKQFLSGLCDEAGKKVPKEITKLFKKLDYKTKKMFFKEFNELVKATEEDKMPEKNIFETLEASGTFSEKKNLMKMLKKLDTFVNEENGCWPWIVHSEYDPEKTQATFLRSLLSKNGKEINEEIDLAYAKLKQQIKESFMFECGRVQNKGKVNFKNVKENLKNHKDEDLQKLLNLL